MVWALAYEVMRWWLNAKRYAQADSRPKQITEGVMPKRSWKDMWCAMWFALRDFAAYC